MTEENTHIVNDDEALLLVKGSRGDKRNDKEYVKKLANAISQVLYKHNVARLRCVGAAAVNNALKSFIISKGESQKKGDEICMDPSFTTVNFSGEEKTAIMIEITIIEE